MKILYQIAESDQETFLKLAGFYGLEAEAIDLPKRISGKCPDILFIGRSIPDEIGLGGPIQNRFSKLIDFSGYFPKNRISKSSFVKLTGKHRLTYHQPYFSHRHSSEESFSGELLLNHLPLEENEKILINLDGYPFLVWKESEGFSVVFSTCDLLNTKSELSFRRLIHLDWFWRAVEIVSHGYLRHRQWAGLFSIRIDDVAGDAQFNILKPMGELAHYTLLAVDYLELKKIFFHQTMLPLCGEICIHAHSHYKYVTREKTRLTYMSWEGDEYEEADLKLSFKDFDDFMETIPFNKRSSVLSPHGFQVGEKALPFLRERKIRHIITPFPPGEPFTSKAHESFKTTPFGNINFHHTLWDSDIYLFYHLWVKPKFDRWGESPKYLLSEEESSATDMLFGLRLFDPPERYYQPLPEIIKRIEDLGQVARIVGFPLILFTHETAINYLGKDGWTDLCGYIQKYILGQYKPAKITDILDSMIR